MKFTTLMSCLSYKVLECDWNMIREESSRCPVAAGVAVGALLSPAAIGEMRNREHVSDMCIWNWYSQGDHHHICWLCPSRPLKINRRGVLDSCAAAELRRCACGVRLGAVHYKLLLLVSPRKRRSKVQPLRLASPEYPTRVGGIAYVGVYPREFSIREEAPITIAVCELPPPRTSVSTCKRYSMRFYVLR